VAAYMIQSTITDAFSPRIDKSMPTAVTKASPPSITPNRLVSIVINNSAV